MNYKRLAALAMCLGCAISAFALGACADDVVPTPNVSHENMSFLKAVGSDVKNEEGEKVQLRGVNAGGLGVIEQWMTGFRSSSGEDGIRCRDHLTTSLEFTSRFGFEGGKALWENYYAGWWSETDFENCAGMGINVLRLPFTYMNVDYGATQGYDHAGQYDFTLLDSFVDGAAQHGIYTILDLHGAYGSQNGQDHSGEVIDSAEDVDFYTNETYISLTERLWTAVAEHYKDDPAVAGYDLLNEPGEKAGETYARHWDVFDRLYRAIRAADDEHIVIFESCWGGQNLPSPAKYGWENCMYSFHHYTNCTGLERFQEHVTSFTDRLDDVEAKNFGVPLYMGEFCCYDNPEQWSYTLGMLNERGWHWTTWTYKVFIRSAWGVYNLTLPAEDKVNAHTDSETDIRKKFSALRTDRNAVKFTFYDGTTLFDMIKRFASPTP